MTLFRNASWRFSVSSYYSEGSLHLSKLDYLKQCPPKAPFLSLYQVLKPSWSFRSLVIQRMIIPIRLSFDYVVSNALRNCTKPEIEELLFGSPNANHHDLLHAFIDHTGYMKIQISSSCLRNVVTKFRSFWPQSSQTRYSQTLVLTQRKLLDTGRVVKHWFFYFEFFFKKAIYRRGTKGNLMWSKTHNTHGMHKHFGFAPVAPIPMLWNCSLRVRHAIRGTWATLCWFSITWCGGKT